VSTVHIAFEIHPETLVVLLSVRSKLKSSVAVKQHNQAEEKVEGDCVLSYGTNYTIDVLAYKFRLQWRETAASGPLRERAI
jgi:hypothetical protein